MLKKNKHSSPEGAAPYRRVNSSVRAKMKEAKENWLDQQCRDIERGFERGDSKKAYETLKVLTKTEKNKSTVIEDKDGKLLTESTAVLKTEIDSVLRRAV